MKDKIKEAFEKIKGEINSLNYQIELIKKSLDSVASFLEKNITNQKYNRVFSNSLARQIEGIKREIEDLKQEIKEKETPAHLRHIADMPLAFEKDKEIKQPKKPEFNHFRHVSTGNEGVPADSQQTVNRQSTHLQHIKIPKKEEKEDIAEIAQKYKEDFEKSFRKLTKQERVIFYMLYSLDDKHGFVDYKMLSSSTNLTPSSIRDYISRLIQKEMPIIKERLNNKKIILKITQNFKNLIKLDTILKILDEEKTSIKDRLSTGFSPNHLDSTDINDIESFEDT